MGELSCLVDLPGLRVSCDEANGWLYNQWLGQHDAASVRQYASSICTCLRARPYTKILSDHSGMAGNWEGAAPWIGREFFDWLAQQGILYFAWVYSLSYHDRVAMEKALFFAARPVVATFGDVATAYDWLRSCPPRPWKSCL